MPAWSYDARTLTDMRPERAGAPAGDYALRALRRAARRRFMRSVSLRETNREASR